MKNKIKTRYGTAMINKDGYYEIVSKKEGNKDKLLHRLIYMDYHHVNYLPKQIHVHHHNGDKKDNCILNLMGMQDKDHFRLHRLGKKLPLTTRMNMSRSKSRSKYYRVAIEKDKSCTQGFIYNYQYYEGDRRRKIKSVDISRLKEKVLSKGLDWFEFNN